MRVTLAATVRHGAGHSVRSLPRTQKICDSASTAHKKLMFRTPDYARISLTFVGLMWVLPFLYYHHAYPLTTFYQEWSAAMLGLCAMPLLVIKGSAAPAVIPRITLLPIALILLVMLQALLGKLVYFEQALLFSLYMLWIALLLLLGHRLRSEIGLPVLVTVLATFLLLGAVLSMLALVFCSTTAGIPGLIR